ncbi:atherin-like isoform X3 [Antechinus flavipes]|uniref:atherin-like isoform X3 n=1 Tax=Antechinus flavipes TaxID=38775 RepID=UPI0022364F15|nr:atherin-like isoform X3 [Antechinus flavipes]
MPTGSAAAGMTPSTGAKHQQPPPLPHSTSATAAARPPARCRRRSTTTTPVPLPAASIPRRCSCHRCRHGTAPQPGRSCSLGQRLRQSRNRLPSNGGSNDCSSSSLQPLPRSLLFLLLLLLPPPPPPPLLLPWVGGK